MRKSPKLKRTIYYLLLLSIYFFCITSKIINTFWNLFSAVWKVDFDCFLNNDLFTDLISWQDFCCLFVSVDKYTHFCTSQESRCTIDVLLTYMQQNLLRKRNFHYFLLLISFGVHSALFRNKRFMLDEMTYSKRFKICRIFIMRKPM